MELRNTKWVNKFRRAAVVHEEGARLLLSHCSSKGSSTLCGEVIYLSGYVGECVLKSLLLSCTPDRGHEKLLKAFKSPKGPGHSLQKLHRLIAVTGFQMPAAMTSRVSIVAGSWNSGMRYDGFSYRYVRHGEETTD